MKAEGKSIKKVGLKRHIRCTLIFAAFKYLCQFEVCGIFLLCSVFNFWQIALGKFMGF